MVTILADYKAQCSAFDELCKATCSNPILFFKGESGSGKTVLLRHCMSRIPDDIQSIVIDCKTGISISEIFSRTRRKLGWESLSNFNRRVDSLTINIQGIEQKGDKNTIDIALRAESEKERENRQTELTDAWFRDIRNIDSRLLMVVDTFEKAVNEVSNWFRGPFLAGIPDSPQMRVLIAGQDTPDPNNIEWGDCCIHHQLLGVLEAQEWMPVVEAKGRLITMENPMNWLAGVCHALKGKPSEIMKIIEALPLKKETA